MGTLFSNIGCLVTLDPRFGASVGEVHGAALCVDDAGIVVWAGLEAEAPAGCASSCNRVDMKGAVVLPGWIDAHTHLVFAGDRTRDYADRCRGVSYEEMARRGGGIRLTVKATRDASKEDLVATGRQRLREFLKVGVTTVEVKTGYGLSLEAELKCLEVIDTLRREGPVRVVPTLLGAHIVPDEFRDRREAYVDMLLTELLPEVARRGLAQFVDVFCDAGAYTLAETRRIFEKAVDCGFGIKVHAEQLTHTGAARLAAEYGAVSADHLEHITREDARVLARAGTVGVLLPGAGLFLGGADKVPARMLIEEGVTVALSTDFNPGSCPSTHLPLMTTLGCSWLGLDPAEAIRGVTVHAAQALALDDGRGSLCPGAPADFAAYDLSDWREIPYRFGHNAVTAVWVGGQKVSGMSADADRLGDGC